MPLITSTSLAQNGVRNRLLATLPAAEYERLLPHLACVELSPGQVLHHPEQVIEHVFFPQSAVLSYVFSGEDGTPLEVGTVGNTGLANVCVALGVDRTPNATEVLIGGTAWRMSAEALRTEVKFGGALAVLLRRYAQATSIHAGQMQVCMRLHSLEERLAGWLLLLDGLNAGDTLPLTHGMIGQMLGVPRSGVSVAANHLQATGLMNYSRGRIMICDRQAMENFACNCFRVIRDEYERVFST